jgi:hypothetical protein
MMLLSRSTLHKLFVLALSAGFAFNIFFDKPANAAEQFYFSSTCLSDITTSENCNISFHRRSLTARFLDGRSINIPYVDIITWNYTDSTRTRIDYELARNIGIVGLLFKRAIHRHVFSIAYVDGYGDKHSLVINFSDSQFILPVKSVLAEYLKHKEI